MDKSIDAFLGACYTFFATRVVFVYMSSPRDMTDNMGSSINPVRFIKFKPPSWLITAK
jgi:hypothetical protein